MNPFNLFWLLRFLQILLWMLLGTALGAIALLATYLVVRLCWFALEYLDTEFFDTPWFF